MIATPAKRANREPTQSEVAAEIERGLRLLFEPGDVFEVRLLDWKQKWGKNCTVSGFFDDITKAAKLTAARELAANCVGIYATLNPVDASLMALAPNQFIEPAKSTAADGDIIRRRRLLFDADVSRKSGISSSDEEHEAALRAAEWLRAELANSFGWSEPVLADSGNGGHLRYAVDLPVDDGGLVAAVLAGAAELLKQAGFDGPPVVIDCSVSNPARIARLLGTTARKGFSIADRPHRRSRIIDAPGELAIVTESQLRELADLAPKPATTTRTTSQPSRNGTHSDHRLKVADYLSHHGIAFRLSDKTSSGEVAKYLLDCCPFNGDHKSPDASVSEYESGATGFKCFHDSCSGNRWREFRAQVGDPLPEHWDPPKEPRQHKPKQRTRDHQRHSHPTDAGWQESTDQQTGSENPHRLTVVSNGWVELTDEGEVTHPLPLSAIKRTIDQVTDGWPRRVGSALFTPMPDDDGVRWIEKHPDLMAYLGGVTDVPPCFHTKPGFHTKDDVMTHLRVTAQAYTGVEEYPHFPPMADVFYACSTPKPGDGRHLERLLDFFNPHEPIDRDLIRAFIATPAWGGPCGARPLHAVTADEGRGSGKSKVAEMVGELFGGSVECSANDSIDRIKVRLFSAEGRTKRVCRLDNVKTAKFSWADLEGLITSPTISGHKLYTGESRRPNSIVWSTTMNGLSLSRDLAQRTIIVKIRRATYSGDWEETVKAFIREHRQAILGDVRAFLEGPSFKLDRYSRWGAWERGVLEKLPDPNEAWVTIRERQNEADSEDDETGIIVDAIRQRLSELDYDVETERVFLPVSIVADWVNLATGQRETVTKISRSLRQHSSENPDFPLRECKSRTNGRGFHWLGSKASSDQPERTDVEHQLEQKERLRQDAFGSGRTFRRTL